MIIDHLSNAKKYNGLHPLFEKAFDFLHRSDLAQLPDGKHEIAGSDLFAIVSRNGDSKAAAPKLEVHRKYLDIHYVIRGADKMGWKFLNTCEKPMGDFSEEKDCQFFSDGDYDTFGLRQGEFAIVYPNDAHQPLVETTDLLKLVLKIKI